MIDIGNKVILIAHQQGLSVEKLAKKVNLKTSSLYRLLKRKDQKISRILQFSTVLNHDFLQYYSIHSGPDINELNELKESNQSLRNKIISKNELINLLQDLIESMKENERLRKLNSDP